MRKLFTLLLAAADVILLVLIIRGGGEAQENVPGGQPVAVVSASTGNSSEIIPEPEILTDDPNGDDPGWPGVEPDKPEPDEPGVPVEDPGDKPEPEPTEPGSNPVEPEGSDPAEPGSEPVGPETVRPEGTKLEIGSVWDYDTSEVPVWEDFDWYSDEIMRGGIDAFPSDKVYRLENFEDIIGGWKGIVTYDPDNNFEKNKWGGSVVHIMRAEISGSDEDVTVYVDWERCRFTKDGTEEEMTEERFYQCSRRDGVIEGYMQNGESIHLTDFFWMDGREYAMGTMTAGDGGPCMIAMYRP